MPSTAINWNNQTSRQLAQNAAPCDALADKSSKLKTRSILHNISNSTNAALPSNLTTKGLKPQALKSISLNTLNNVKKQKLKQNNLTARHISEHFPPNKRAPFDPSDADDLENPRYVAEYISDIITHYTNQQDQPIFRISSSYMSKQTELNSRMRELLIDWLNQVHAKFELCAPTFFLAVALLDRFLGRVNCKRGKLQLIGCTCLWLACKYEEIYAPEMEDFVTISDNAFSRSDMLKAEKMVLEVLKYMLGGPTVYVFVRRFLKAIGASVRLQFMTAMVLEMAMQKLSMMEFKPSLLAAAALRLCCVVGEINVSQNGENLAPDGDLNVEEEDFGYDWDEVMQRVTGFDEKDEELCTCAVKLQRVVVACMRGNRKMKAVASKYADEKHLQVSLMEFDVDVSEISAFADVEMEETSERKEEHMEEESEDERN